MNVPHQVTDKEQRARRLLSDCRQHLSRGDAAAAAHMLMRAVNELGQSSGHSTSELRASMAQKLSSPQDLHSLLERLEISTRQSLHSFGCSQPAATSVESSRASSQQCFELLDARGAHNSHTMHMDIGGGATPAIVDSESFQCPHCGGVFATVRREQHLRNWCPAAPTINAEAHLDTYSDDGMVT